MVQKGVLINLKDRFLDYWQTDYAYDDYTYNLSIFEQISYGVIGSIGGLILIVSIIASVPIWIVPYLIYKALKCNNKGDN